jgi:SRSO17 transposase
MIHSPTHRINLADPAAVLVVDETGFLKKGTKSAGVARQYSGTAGRIENCQVGVFLAYAASDGVALLDRELYLPQAWTDDRVRCREAGIPDEVEFATKPALAKEMLERAVIFGVPHAWVAGDEIYGMDWRLRCWLEERGKPFVLAVSSQERCWVGLKKVRVDEAARSLPESAWRRRSAGAGAKGERLYDWALIEESRPGERAGVHRILVRRNVKDPLERAYYVVFSPQGATLEELVRVAGRRWAIEIAFEAAKQEVGLGQYEGRKWDAWYRFITLALFAHVFLAVQRAKKGEPEAAVRS